MNKFIKIMICILDIWILFIVICSNVISEKEGCFNNKWNLVSSDKVENETNNINNDQAINNDNYVR